MSSRVAGTVLCMLCLLPFATSSPAAPPEEDNAASRGRGVVVGLVMGTDGAPVGDVRVSLSVRLRGGRADSREVRTGADGRYRFEDVPPGDVTAFVADRGLVARGIADYLAADAGALGRTLRAGTTVSIDLVVEPGARIAGQLLRATGGPLADTRVEAVPADDPADRPFAPPSVSADTAPDGRFALEGLVPGLAYDVRVLPAGGPPFVRPRVPAGILGAAPLAFRLPGLRELRLAVVQEEEPRSPVAGARARVRRERDDSHEALGLEVQTDARGRARLLVPEGEAASVHVEAPGWTSARRLPLPATDEVVARLARLRVIRGRVLLPDGTPAVGMDVGVLTEDWEASSAEGRTGEGGIFTLDGAPPGPVVVAAGVRKPDGTLLRAMTLAGAHAKDVIVRLETVRGPSRAPLRVQAVGPDGSLVSRAFVAVRTTKGGTIAGPMEAGSTTFDLEDMPPGVEGATVLVAHAEDEEGAPLPLGPAVVGPLAAGTTTVEVHLPAERVLEGRVHGPRGEPVTGARVQVGRPQFPIDDVRSRLEAGGRAGSWGFERTDHEGRFRIHGLPDEAMRVFVDPPLPYAAPPPTPVRRGTSRVDLTVETAGRTEVTVLDPAGAPVVGAHVCAVAVGGHCPSDSTSTDARGVAAVTGVLPGRKCVLRVEPSWDFLVWTKAAWDPAPTTVRLERAYELSGAVLAPNGAPIVRAFVKHDDPGTEWWARSEETDDEGRFGFRRLRAGPLTLSAELGDGLTGSEEASGPVTVRVVHVEAGARDVRIVLEPGRTVEVVPPVGTPEGARIEVRCTRGPHLLRGIRIASRRERLFVSGLTDDDRLTFLMPPDASGRSVATAATPADSPVRLDRRVEGTIRGRVVLPEGAVGASLRAVEERLDLTLDGEADATGRYEIDGVPEGWSWTVEAWTEVGGTRHEGTMKRVRAGEAPDLLLRPAR